MKMQTLIGMPCRNIDLRFFYIEWKRQQQKKYFTKFCEGFFSNMFESTSKARIFHFISFQNMFIVSI